MSDSIIKMDYDLMDEMSREFARSSQTLCDVLNEMQQLAAAMEGGALLGRGGVAFSAALRERLCPSIQRLSVKFDELSADVHGAMVRLRDGDIEAESRFLD
jgi:WXG100 family type VII secretion target